MDALTEYFIFMVTYVPNFKENIVIFLVKILKIIEYFLWFMKIFIYIATRYMNLKKYIFIIALSFTVIAETKATNECFEGTSRAIFKFNMAFDNAILEPIAKGYNKLPNTIKNGTSNFTSNIATLLSIPNHVLQGNFRNAGDATASFLINTTIGIIGLANPAEKLGFRHNRERRWANLRSLRCRSWVLLCSTNTWSYNG